MALSTLELMNVPGRIGMMAAPGRNHRVIGNPPAERLIVHDLRELQRWGAAELVSLIEPHELTRLELSQLPRLARDFGLVWCHLPIRDRDVPGPDFEHDWIVEGPRIHERLRRGEGVVFHCHAGLGRTGMIVARLLVELGTLPDDAIARVREVRRGTIETSRQEDYVRYFDRLRPPPGPRRMR